jgi:glycine/D-amino acid oxidase-like deaminating enzyme
MRITTDYLVIGAGASGLAFTDTLVAHADVDVVLVDRNDAPGGHWVHAYPFVVLHSPRRSTASTPCAWARTGVDERGPWEAPMCVPGRGQGFLGGVRLGFLDPPPLAKARAERPPRRRSCVRAGRARR